MAIFMVHQDRPTCAAPASLQTGLSSVMMDD